MNNPVIPPFFSTADNLIFFSWNFPWQSLSLCIFAIVLYLLSNKKLNFHFVDLLPSISCFCLLFMMALIFKAISIFSKSSSGLNVNKPDTFVHWIFCILGFIFAAFYEEVIYRFYFTDFLLKLVNGKFNNTFVTVFCELTGVLVFAFAHFYLGWFSVINAAFAHLILRSAYKKTKSIWTSFLAHFFYNIISLILL